MKVQQVSQKPEGGGEPEMGERRAGVPEIEVGGGGAEGRRKERGSGVGSKAPRNE